MTNPKLCDMWIWRMYVNICINTDVSTSIVDWMKQQLSCGHQSALGWICLPDPSVSTLIKQERPHPQCMKGRLSHSLTHTHVRTPFSEQSWRLTHTLKCESKLRLPSWECKHVCVRERDTAGCQQSPRGSSIISVVLPLPTVTQRRITALLFWIQPSKHLAAVCISWQSRFSVATMQRCFLYLHGLVSVCQQLALPLSSPLKNSSSVI